MLLPLFFYFLFGILFWVTGFYIIYRAKDPAFYFLAAHFFIVGIGVITRSVLFNDMIHVVPHIYGILMPLQFLYGPLYYFFLKWVFKKQSQFKLIDTLHLVPFFFNLIDFIPFVVMPGSSKIELFQSKGILSILGITNESYDLLKVVSYVFYMLLAAIFYLQYIDSTKIVNKKETVLIHSWLRLDFLMKCIAIVSTVIIGLINKNDTFTVSYYFYSADVLLNLFIVFVWPKLLNGIPVTYVQNSITPIKKQYLKLKENLKKSFYKSVVQTEISVTKNKILSFKADFANRNFDAIKLANLLNIDKVQLIEFCAQTYQCDIDTLINSVRLMIMAELVSKSSKPLLKNIIYEAGFESIVHFENLIYTYRNQDDKFHFNITPESYQLICLLYRQQINTSFI
jgi:hypothetical protein